MDSNYTFTAYAIFRMEQRGITAAEVVAALNAPLATKVQENGRIATWGAQGNSGYVIKVITEQDRATVINAHRDRNFRIAR